MNISIADIESTTTHPVCFKLAKIINKLSQKSKELYARSYYKYENFVEKIDTYKLSKKRNKVVEQVMRKSALFIINPKEAISELANYTHSGRKKRIEWCLKHYKITQFIFYRLDYETLKSPATTYRYIAKCLGYHEDTVAEYFAVLQTRGLVKVKKYKIPKKDKKDNDFATRSIIELLPRFFQLMGCKLCDVKAMQAYHRKKSRKKSSSEKYQDDQLKKKTFKLMNKSQNTFHISQYIENDDDNVCSSQSSTRQVLTRDQTLRISDLVCNYSKTPDEAYLHVMGHPRPNY